MASKLITLKDMRANAEAQVPPRVGLRVVFVVVLLQALVAVAAMFLVPAPARAQTMKGEVSTNTGGGYARLVFTFTEDNDAEVRLANGILIISFNRPVDLSVDGIASAASAFISAARRDPDGTAVRIALTRKVTVNSMAAGERFFVDLLPDNWVGVPPGLPQEVVDQLARRAREAERKVRQAVVRSRQQEWRPIKVRLGSNPTFTRYVFQLPEVIPVTVDHDKEKLTLSFEAPLRFDLVDVKAALPPSVAEITAEPGQDTVEVRFRLKGKVDVRTFRDDANFIVDLTPAEAGVPGNVTAKPNEIPGPFTALPDEKARPTPSASEPSNGRSEPVAPATPPGAGTKPPREAQRPPERATSPPPQPVAKSEDAAKPAASPAGAVAPPPRESAQAFPPVQGMADVTMARPKAGSIVAEVQRQGDALRLVFPFNGPTSAAVFRRFDTLWLVFDTGAPIDVSQLLSDPGRLIRTADVSRSQDGQVVRLKLDRPRLASASTNGPSWSVALGDTVLDRTAPLTLARASIGGERAVAVVPFEQPSRVHHVSDPEVGDKLLVVTAPGPARGLLRTQEFVEFRALAATHGIAVQPLADDLSLELNPDKVVIARPSGLTLSSVSYRLGEEMPQAGQSGPFDPMRWGADRRGSFNERQGQLMQAVAAAPEGRRAGARLDLARFYLGREMFPEAKAVLDVALAEERPGSEDPSALLLRAVAKVMMQRNAEALTDLANPILANRQDTALWRGFAHARQGQWAEAREGFKSAEGVMPTLPIELQRAALKEQLRAAIEVSDLAEAAQAMNELTTIGVPDDMHAGIAVLAGRLAEALGRISDAQSAYQSAAASGRSPDAAQGRLRDILFRYSLKQLVRADAISELEGLTTLWRGDETELEALQLLVRLYLEEQRYRDAFYVMRNTAAAFPKSPIARRIQDETAAAFESLFLEGGADAMPPIEALSLFYDFRDLTPIGRRGDEIIRRLADRLVAMDLLGQAAELLQHQVDNRLQGAARAQVATRLAVIYLMNRKPDRALQIMRATRASDLSNELRNQRLLLEARALSDTGRHDLALEVIVNLSGREVDRLRADILWSGRRWREAGEQIEKLYGERWREFTPLSETERPDILRAAIGYALGEDQLGLDRWREKYGAKMAEGPLARAFEVVTTPFASSGPEFRAIAKAAVAADTLEQFLRDMRARYPEPSPPDSQSRPAEPRRSTSGSLPANARHSAARQSGMVERASRRASAQVP